MAGLVALGADAAGLRTALNVELGLEALLRDAPGASSGPGQGSDSGSGSDEAVVLPAALRQALRGAG